MAIGVHRDVAEILMDNLIDLDLYEPGNAAGTMRMNPTKAGNVYKCGNASPGINLQRDFITKYEKKIVDLQGVNIRKN